VVVDDHPVFRKGLVCLLQEIGAVQVVGEAGDLAGTRAAVEQCRPDLLICDLMLEKTSVIELIKELRDRFPSLKILVVSMMEEAVFGPRVLRAGGHGFIMKGASADELKRALHTVLSGSAYLNTALAATLVKQGTTGGAGAASSVEALLSDRELEIFRLVGEGLASRHIAENLKISHRTVDAHKLNIRTKLNLPSIGELNKRAAVWVENLKG
jgi:DNA-binding NarL/FixJ family response regulator